MFLIVFSKSVASAELRRRFMTAIDSKWETGKAPRD